MPNAERTEVDDKTSSLSTRRSAKILYRLFVGFLFFNLLGVLFTVFLLVGDSDASRAITGLFIYAGGSILTGIVVLTLRKSRQLHS